jgi:hypothetical protein
MKKISRNRVLIQKNGFQVIKPSNIDLKSEIIPLFCPVCERQMISSEDIESYKQFQCCENCDTWWVRQNIEKWKNGWRPDREDIEKNILDRNLDVITVHT